MFQGRVNNVTAHMTQIVGTELLTNSGISVKMLIINWGHNEKNTSRGNTVTRESTVIRRITGMTPTGFTFKITAQEFAIQDYFTTFVIRKLRN